MSKKIYAFIFAKSQSLRLKNKNLQKIKKQTLLELSIKCAKKNKKISKIFVSSDSTKILKEAKKNKVNIIKRPKNLCTPFSNAIYSWKHAVNYLFKKKDYFDIFVSLPTTSPLRSQQDVNKLIKKYENKKSDITISASKTNRYPFFNMITVDKKGFAKIAIKERKKFKKNKFYEISTVGYVTNPNYILSVNNYFSGKVNFVEIPRSRGLDIDDKFDLNLARKLFK